MTEEYNPLREYQRIVRSINLQKLRLASVEERIAKRPRRYPTAPDDEAKRFILTAIALLELEGEAHLQALRERSRN